MYFLMRGEKAFDDDIPLPTLPCFLLSPLSTLMKQKKCMSFSLQSNCHSVYLSIKKPGLSPFPSVPFIYNSLGGLFQMTRGHTFNLHTNTHHTLVIYSLSFLLYSLRNMQHALASIPIHYTTEQDINKILWILILFLKQFITFNSLQSHSPNPSCIHKYVYRYCLYFLHSRLFISLSLVL